MSEPALPARITSFIGGGLVTGFVGVFAAMITWSAAGFAVSQVGIPVALAYGGATSVLVAGLLAVYAFLSTEWVVEVDRERIRFFGQRRLGPFRGRPDVIIDAPWAAVGRVREAVETSRTKHGDEQKRYALQVGESRIDGGLLGTMGRDGKYLELLRAVRAAIGDRLETDGPL